MSAFDSHSEAISDAFDAFDGCEDSQPTPEEEQWSSDTLVLATHAQMAKHAGRLARSTDGQLIEMHLKFVVELLLKYGDDVSVGRRQFNSSDNSSADEFLRESFVAMRGLWSNPACENPQKTLAEFEYWEDVLGVAALQGLMNFVCRFAEDNACDSVVDAGFDLLDSITRRPRGTDDHHSFDQESSHYEFEKPVLKRLIDLAFGERQGHDGCSEDSSDDDAHDGVSKKATMLRATQTLLTYVTPTPSDPPCARRAENMIQAGILNELLIQIDQLSFWRANEKEDGDRRSSGAFDNSEEDTVREHPLDERRLQTCLALLARVLQLHAIGIPLSFRYKLGCFLCTMSRMIRGPSSYCFSAGERRKALQAMTAVARHEYEYELDYLDAVNGVKKSLFAEMTSAALIGWHEYIKDECVTEKKKQLASVALSETEKQTLEQDYDLTFLRGMKESDPDFFEEFGYVSIPYDKRLTATDVGPSLCEAAQLFEMFSAETRTKEWYGKLSNRDALSNDATHALVHLTSLAISRGIYSEGCPRVWHAKCAHAGAVLHAALFMRAENLGLLVDPELPGEIPILGCEFEKLRDAMEMNLDPEDKGKIMRLFAGTLGRRNLGDVPGARRTIMLRQLDRKRKQNEKVNTNEVIAKPAPNAPTKRPRVVTETHENVCTRRSQRRKVAKA